MGSSDSSDVFEWPVRVYYEDTDAQGVVYYANYFRFMERARTEWLRRLGFDQKKMLNEERRMFVVVSTRAEFVMPANLTAQYHKAEERFRAATADEEKVAGLEEMLRHP